jgi:hypothetical protein
MGFAKSLTHPTRAVRSPDAAQREAMRCYSGVHLWVPALRSSAARRTASGTRDRYRPSHFGGRFSENAFGPSM